MAAEKLHQPTACEVLLTELEKEEIPNNAYYGDGQRKILAPIAEPFSPAAVTFRLEESAETQVVERQKAAPNGFRLSPQQRHLWALLQYGCNGPYQTKCAVTIRGYLERGDLKTAVQNVVTRHEILRTTFQCPPGMAIPMQVIGEIGNIAWQEDDISGLDEQASLIEALFQATPHPFDFEQGPLLCVHLIKKAKDDYVMILRLPAICADSVSLVNLVGELSRSHSGPLRGEDLDHEVLQYADLSEWLNDLIEAEEMRVGREYWHNRNLLLQSAPRLAFERIQTSEATFEPRLEELEIAPSLTVQIESFARSKETSIDRILLACWQILLWRYTGQSEIEVGTAFDCRRSVEIENALGLFAKYLPITCHLDEEFQFCEIIEQIDQSLQIVGDWQEYFSWEQIVESAESAQRESFFPFCFEPESPLPTFMAGGVSFTLCKQYSCIDRFKIKLSCARKANGVGVEFHFDSELFHPADIRYLIGRFETLLKSVIANPVAKIGELEMLTVIERQQLLFEYNATNTEWPQDKLVHELISEQVERTPDAVAVICEEERLTYRELNDCANKLAHHLRGLGVGPEVIVGLCLQRSRDLVVSLIAILKAGGAYLPLDPSYPQDRLSFMLEDATVNVLLTETRLCSRLPSIASLQAVYVDTLWESISQASTLNCKPALSPENLAYVIYTSGSTGRPKGVMLRHGSLKNYLLWAVSHYPLDVGCGAPVHSSLSFDLTITALFTPLLAGGFVRLLSSENEAESLGAALSDRPGYSLVKLTPSHLQLLTEQLGNIELNGVTQSLVVGGENLPAKTVSLWLERAATTRLFNEYGPTESVVGCSAYEAGAKGEVEKDSSVLPIGRPIANTSLYILDERQRPVALGVVGELHIGGAGLARGYLNRPDLTAERFAPHPYSTETGTRFYQTGDLARFLRDGQIECLGRIDDQVKVRGYRIELGEIEARLGEHPAVEQAAVIAIEEGSEKRLVGYVVMKDGEGSSASELREYLKERLPEYMAPAAYVRLERMPLTTNGKVNKKALPQPGAVGNEQEESCHELRTEVEEAMAGIWRQILRVDRVGVEDNFFDLGGHSLLGIRVVSSIGDVFNVELPLMAIFEEKTLADLSRRVETEMRTAAGLRIPPIEKASREGRLPLSFAQQRLWFIDQLEPGGATYNIPSALRVSGELAWEPVEQVLSEVVRRHEVLRTRFEVREGEPVQMIDEATPIEAPVIDVSGLEERQREEEARRVAAEEAARGFDLNQGPLLRVGIVKLGRQDQALLVTMHHVVSDEWSMIALKNEVNRIYAAYSRGESSPLEELPIQYADYAVWQRGWLQGETLERELDYWRKQLAGVEMLKLPTDHSRQSTPSYRGARQMFLLETELVTALRRLSREEGATLFMTLMAAFQTLLYRYTGREDIVVGTPIANRNRLELEGLIGFFVNTLALRTKLSPEGSFRDLLRQVRKTALAAYSHDQVPFERLVMELAPKRVAGQNPIFQTLFYLDDAFSNNASTLPEILISSVKSDFAPAKLDLALTMVAYSHKVRGNFTYATDLFEPETISTMIERFQSLLQAVVSNPDFKLLDIPLADLSAKETQTALNTDDMQADFIF